MCPSTYLFIPEGYNLLCELTFVENVTVGSERMFLTTLYPQAEHPAELPPLATTKCKAFH